MTSDTVQESVELLESFANGVMADGSVSAYPLHATAILNVVAAMKEMDTERNALYGNYTRSIQREIDARDMCASLAKDVDTVKGKLAAVTAERDALRQLMPSWSSAPKQAMYLTMDEDGRWGWHEAAPSPCSNMWSVATWLGDAHVGAWQTMIFERPTR